MVDGSLGFLMMLVASDGQERWVGCFCLDEEKCTKKERGRDALIIKKN